jgi:hypothetical protein
MAEDEFTEDDFEEDLPPKPAPRIIKPTAPAAAAPRRPQPVTQSSAQAPQPIATRDVATPTEKYTPYTIPQRMGVFDNEQGKPIIEDTDMMGVLFALLTKMANDIDEIKGRL